MAVDVTEVSNESLAVEMGEADEVLAAILGEAEKGEEPGTLRMRDIIHKGDEDLPVPIMAMSLKSAGYSIVFDTRTGERSLINNNQFAQQLRKKRDDGSRMFATKRPNIAPVRGTIMCLLHQSNPSRPTYDALRFPLCNKANLISELELRSHMEHRHARVWATLEEERKRIEREEDRSLHRAILEQAARGARATVEDEAAAEEADGDAPPNGVSNAIKKRGRPARVA